MFDSPLSASAYDVLGVAPDVDDDALRKAYRLRLRQTHPDTGGDAATADKVAAAAVAKVVAGVGSAAEVTGAVQQLALVRHSWATLGAAEKQELRDRWADALRPLGVQAKLAAWQSPPAPARELDYLAALQKLQHQQQSTAMISNDTASEAISNPSMTLPRT